MNSKAMKDKIDAERMTRQLNEILKSRKGKRTYHRASMGKLPSANVEISSDQKQMQPLHFPISRLDQNKMMFNEIFVKPKLDQLKKLEVQREQELTKLKLPSIYKSNKVPNKTRKEDENVVGKALVEENQRKLKDANKNDKSLDISSLLERRRFNKNTDNLFGDDFEEEAFKKLDNTDVDQFNTQDFKDLHEKENEGGNQYEFKNYIIDSTQDEIEEDQNDIVRVIMKKFNSKAKSKNKGSFFTQQIQVQPPEGLINLIGSEGSWAPSIPLLNSSTNKSLSKTKGKERSLNDTSLMDIKMRAKAGVQAGDVKKEAHMAFCLGSLNEDKNIHKSIRYYKRFFFCARILEDPVGAALALNRLGVAYHKLKNYEKSLMFHMKHKEYTDKENLFAAYYNLGISQRLMKNNDEAVQFFTKALESAVMNQELDSECYCNGQLGITELIRRNQEVSNKHFDICYKIAKMLRSTRLQLDCLLCLGYIYFSK